MSITLPKSTKEQLRALGVQCLYLFGSRAQGADGPLSDYDFAVLMSTAGNSRGDTLHDRIYDLLAPLCERTLKNDVIDIVFVRDVSLEMRFHIIRYGKILLDTDPLARANFESETQLLYCDYRPILDEFDNAILATI